MTDHAQLARIAKYGANPGDREDLLARIGNLQRRRVIYQAYSARRSARSVSLASGWRLFRDGERRTRCAYGTHGRRATRRGARQTGRGKPAQIRPAARLGAGSARVTAARAARTQVWPGRLERQALLLSDSQGAGLETVAPRHPAQVEATCGVIDVHTRRPPETGP